MVQDFFHQQHESNFLGVLNVRCAFLTKQNWWICCLSIWKGFDKNDTWKVSNINPYNLTGIKYPRVVDLARFIKPPNPGESPIFRSSLVPSVADCFRKMFFGDNFLQPCSWDGWIFHPNSSSYPRFWINLKLIHLLDHPLEPEDLSFQRPTAHFLGGSKR